MKNNIFKKILTITAIIGATGIAATALAAGAGFNNLSGDEEFLRGQNISAGQTDYQDPVSANPGDEIKGLVYYHNTDASVDGSAGETALNTRVRLTLPQTLSPSHLISGELWADNAAKVTGTFVNGQEVGNVGLTINTTTNTVLEFVTGSIRWYPNKSTTPVDLPFNQTGDEIISSSGLNIGDISGCWQFAGFITYKLKPRAAGVNFEKLKSAWNVTQNVDATSKNALAGDEIRYSLITKNTGQDQGELTVSDNIADVLEFAEISDLAGGVLAGGTISYGSVTIAAGATVTKSFTVKVKNPLPLSGDYKMVNTYGNTITVEIEPPAVGGEPIIKIYKKIRNKSRNESFSTGSIAHIGDIVEYQIIIQNFHGSNVVENLNIKDILDPNLMYIAGSGRLEIADQTKSLSDDIFKGTGWTITDPVPSLGPIGNNDRLTIYLEALISQDAKKDSFIANQVCAKASNLPGEICDKVSALIEIPTSPTTPAGRPSTTPAIDIPGQPPVIFQPGPIQIPKTGPVETLALVFGLSASAVIGSQYLRSKKALLKASMKKIIS